MRAKDISRSLTLTITITTRKKNSSSLFSKVEGLLENYEVVNYELTGGATSPSAQCNYKNYPKNYLNNNTQDQHPHPPVWTRDEGWWNEPLDPLFPELWFMEDSVTQLPWLLEHFMEETTEEEEEEGGRRGLRRSRDEWDPAGNSCWQKDKRCKGDIEVELNLEPHQHAFVQDHQQDQQDLDYLDRLEYPSDIESELDIRELDERLTVILVDNADDSRALSTLVPGELLFVKRRSKLGIKVSVDGPRAVEVQQILLLSNEANENKLVLVEQGRQPEIVGGVIRGGDPPAWGPRQAADKKRVVLCQFVAVGANGEVVAESPLFCCESGHRGAKSAEGAERAKRARDDRAVKSFERFQKSRKGF